VAFREDILRGVRLFAIVFAGILVCVAGYRTLRTPSEAQGPGAPPEAVEPAQEASSDAPPVSEAASEAHPLVVPEPPPVPGAAPVVKRAVRAKVIDDPGVPPPPPLGKPHRAATPTGREFESSEAVSLPAAPVEDTSDAHTPAPKQGVGYKSLIEANANRPTAEPAPAAPVVESTEKPAKGNRFFRAIGKIFHPGGAKDATPLTLQPKEQ
jgi:hypothetical protein